MASSDDESEELLQSVSNYYFEDENYEPISFSFLPIQWSEVEKPVGEQKDVSLRGSADKGLQKVFKQVVAWKYDISGKNPEVYVLSKENVWIKLQKPKKSFEETIRSVLVTVQCLHFVKKNPEMAGKSVWDHLSKVFSWYEVLPNENDLMDQITLIREAVKSNTDLEKSKFLLTLLEEKPGKRKSYGEDAQPTKKTRFMVDDDDDDDMYGDEIAEGDDSDDIFDSVCAICDNGGELVCCEGICLRSFHATVEAGSESLCDSLGFSKREIDAIDFKCENCLYQQHQCFVCGKLGSSKESDAEVSKCLNATCGFFYHPHCVSKLIHQNDKAAAEELEKRMAQGDRVTCPIHKCCVCGQGENREVLELQFAVCRRCPRSYHRKCLPKNIAFEDDEDNGIITRAWDDLLPSRILIYCLDHKIEKEIGTPIRSHIVFPSSKKTDIKKKKVFVEAKKIKQTTPSPRNAEKVASKKINIIPRDSTEGTIAVKGPRLNDRSASAMKLSSDKHIEKKTLPGSDVPRKVKADNSSRKPLNDNAKFIPVEADKDALGNKLFEFMQKSELVKPGKVDTHAGEPSKLATVEAETKELSSALPPLDVESRRRILSLMKDAASSISLEDVKKEYDVPSTHAHSSIVDKFMTEGKVQGAVEAARTALKKLEEGCSMEDAAAVCNKHVLKQLFKWRNQLRGYLAPFQYGMRYTSFGRHFTQLDKLQKIVDKLHWYVKDGDMIVDFCCGANDFSILMKKKLEETGKKCSYKNYDIMPPKNDFCYEKRDWMTVEPKELPSGSQLIMGLNPPFGIQAQLANKFINKALEFKPKLLILIAPPETEKLDEKNTPYDLVWEDYQVLSGKSFYLPGSVDVNDKQMEQWNVTPPLLCLWSRPDWSSKHLEIAEKHGQNSVQPENSDFRKNSSGTFCPDHPLDDQEQNVVIPSLSKNNLPIQANEPEGSAIETAVREGSSSARSGTSLGSSREKEGRGNILEEEKEDITNNERSSVSLEVVQNSKLGGMRNYQPLRVETPYGGTLGSLPDEPGRVYRSWPSELNPGWNINQEFVGSRRGNLADEYRWSSYMIEQEEKNRREFELRDRLRLYGQQQDSGYGQMGQFASSYGHHQYGPVAEPVYRMSSTALGPTSSVPTMRRYEPKLDELNHTRVNGLGPPGPGFRGIPGPYPMNFASGPHPASYPHHESSSWLNE